jgi:hypothetical protein
MPCPYLGFMSVCSKPKIRRNQYNITLAKFSEMAHHVYLKISNPQVYPVPTQAILTFPLPKEESRRESLGMRTAPNHQRRPLRCGGRLDY